MRSARPPGVVRGVPGGVQAPLQSLHTAPGPASEHAPNPTAKIRRVCLSEGVQSIAGVVELSTAAVQQCG